MAVFNPFDFFLEPAADHFPFIYEPELARDLTPYLDALVLGPKLGAFLREVPQKGGRTIDFLVDLIQRLQKRVAYVIRMEPGIQTCEETLSLQTGSCRDSAWLMVQASFATSAWPHVSSPDTSSNSPPTSRRLMDLQRARLRFYRSARLGRGLSAGRRVGPGSTPTSGMFAGEGHIPARLHAREPGAAAPITGQLDPCETDFGYEMKLARIVETPRVTRPYTEEQWRSILSLGDKVEADLSAEDVRLTMGGEPTFVSIDDPDGPEWNHLAPRSEKTGTGSYAFLGKMRDHFALRCLAALRTREMVSRRTSSPLGARLLLA